MRILICKPSSLGDVVQAMAVLRHIKRYIPESEIYWWVSTAFAPLLKHDPDIAGIFLFDKKSLCQLRDLPKHIRQIRTIRKMRFDVVLDLQSLLRSAVFAWLCKGQRTIGLDDRRELAPIFYDVAIPRPTPQTHAVDWYFVLPEPSLTYARFLRAGFSFRMYPNSPSGRNIRMWRRLPRCSAPGLVPCSPTIRS